MMLRQTVILGTAMVAFASVGHAQTRGQSRDDLLDALTRHIQICGEMTGTEARLACYDRLQTQVGGVQGSAPAAAAPAPTPTPLQSGGTTAPPAGSSTGSSISSSPLTPQPLGVPGGGVATLGGGTQPQPSPLAQPQDPNAAFDPRTATQARPPEGLQPKPRPPVRRTGARPIPYSATPQPLVVLGASNLTYGDSRYWQVSITLTSNTPRPIETQAQCTFMNAGRPIEDVYFGPVTIQPGEQISTDLVGPPTTAYIDSTNCRVVSP
ncbi:MAG: hypothetical protein HYZ40_16545 [Rhodospirillales bacterium]|nr:hypothetical protein [Rhodospirillales bacterium]